MRLQEAVVHDTLNKKLFDENDNMKEDVRERLLEIVDEFLGSISDDINIKILDIRLLGSNASYNYTDHSDLDLHIVVNFENICRECPEILQQLLNAEKARFNASYDITVKGIETEVYVEDVKAGTLSNGIYSILKDEWVKFPDKSLLVDTSDIDVTDEQDFIDLKFEAESALQNGDSETIEAVIDDIYMQRKNSLEADGEYGIGNLIFKEIRNLGLLDDLKSKYYEVRSQELTLEGKSLTEAHHLF